MSEKTILTSPKRVSVARRQPGTTSAILVRFKVSPQTLIPLKGLVPHNKLTKASLRKQNKAREEAGAVMEIDVFDYNRRNSANILVADTGEEMLFNKEDVAKGNKFSMKSLAENLDAIGYKLIEVYSIQKTTDNKPTLVFEFNRPDEVEGAQTYPAIVEETFKVLSEASWDFVHCWNNPDDTVTINAAGRSENKKCGQLRIDRLYIEQEKDWATGTLPMGIYLLDCPSV